MAPLLIPLLVASTASQVIGTLTAGNEAAKVGGRNAELYNQRAIEASNASNEREAQIRQRNNEALSAQRTAMLANGVDPGTGSALVGASQQTVDADMDALTERYRGILESRDFRVRGKMARWEGKAAKRASRISAAGKLLEGVGTYMLASGFGAKGPGFSGQQAAAPVTSSGPWRVGN